MMITQRNAAWRAVARQADSLNSPQLLSPHVSGLAKNRNTFEKHRRELEKKRNAEEKRVRRRQKKNEPSPSVNPESAPAPIETPSPE